MQLDVGDGGVKSWPCPPSSVCGGGRVLGVVEESNEVTVSGGNGLNCPAGGVAADGVSQSVE